MKARDVMVSPVITISEGGTVRDLAKLLLANHISAMPVVDSGGKLVGIVSEADLMHRSEASTERPASWWLSIDLGRPRPCEGICPEPCGEEGRDDDRSPDSPSRHASR